MMNRSMLLLTVAAGAAIMYFLDPDRGASRRAMARNKALQARDAASEQLDRASKVTRDLSNRAQGVISDMRKTVRSVSPDAESFAS